MLTCFFLSFFFTDPATPEIYTLSLHDALPISGQTKAGAGEDPPDPREHRRGREPDLGRRRRDQRDRKSTRLNSSHLGISYAVFCLKKKKKNKYNTKVNAKKQHTT